jgi:hypothetical protein
MIYLHAELYIVPNFRESFIVELRFRLTCCWFKFYRIILTNLRIFRGPASTWSFRTVHDSAFLSVSLPMLARPRRRNYLWCEIKKDRCIVAPYGGICSYQVHAEWNWRAKAVLWKAASVAGVICSWSTVSQGGYEWWQWMVNWNVGCVGRPQ